MNTQPPADFPLPEQLDRYLAGDASRDERAAVEKWAADPDCARVLQAVQAAWELDGAGRSPRSQDWNVDSHWQQMQSRMRQISVGGGSRPKVARNWSARRAPWMGIVLGSAACLVAAFVWTHGTPPSSENASAVRVVMTRPAERATFRLPDGSTVTAAPGTNVRVAAGFPGKNRDVYLDGEAVFQVVPQAGQPFVVHVDGVAAKVLGTRFGVRKYASDGGNVRVAVADGRVSVAGHILAAGDIARIGDTTVPVITRHADVESVLGWTHGRLVFEAAPLSVVAHELSRWYDISVTIADPALARLPVNLTLDATYAIDVVAQIIRVTTGADVIARGDSVLISTRR